MRAASSSIAVSAFALGLSLAPVATAQDAVFHGEERDWRVFTRGEGDARICYVQSTPQEANPASANHGDVFFLVASWANGDADEQPSFLSGQLLRPDSPPRVRIGSDRYRMFVSEREGFVESPDDEEDLVGDMRRGSTMRVEATHSDGTLVAYEFSLSGVTAALQSADRLCR
ncbi:invasion associated locus B family protein [Maricaulaceae bacterium EIL42A08]|nr:invasion associated locus B family protein [Maricaulaceae bacterium EIL42A08]